MKNKINKEFEKEIELLKEELSPEELFILGYLKGSNRNDLKMMIN